MELCDCCEMSGEAMAMEDMFLECDCEGDEGDAEMFKDCVEDCGECVFCHCDEYENDFVA